MFANCPPPPLPAEKESRIQALVADGYISRHSLFAFNGAPLPLYYPTRKGAELLAAHYDDAHWLAANTACPHPHLLYHWMEITNTHLTLDEAVARQTEVRIEAWINEWAVVNPRESAPEKRYTIFTQVQDNPRLVAAPDAAFLLGKGGARKCYLLEQDRNSSSPEQVAASKHKGYAAMAERNLHLRIFPAASAAGFTVLVVTTEPKRRDQLRRAFRDKLRPDLWKFVAASDMTAETALTAAIVHPVEGAPRPLVRPGGAT